MYQAIELIEKMKKHRVGVNAIDKDTFYLDQNLRIQISDLSEIRSYKKNQKLHLDLNKLNNSQDSAFKTKI